MNGRVFENWELSKYFDITNQTLKESLNNLFKGEAILDISHLKILIDKYKEELKKIFITYKKTDIEKETFSASIFEFLPTILLDKLCKALNHRVYSASFSKNPLEPMMWAHYAEGFRGCVVIYNALEDNTLELRHHYQTPINQSEVYEYKKVKYLNKNKCIPLLQSAIDKNNVLLDSCLIKNSFWDYEKEYRLLTTIEIESIRHAHIEDSTPSSRDRILYHDPNSILGVIFGPRCPKEYKDKIQLIIGDTRKFNGNKPFFLFTTELSSFGEIKILQGEYINSRYGIEMRQILKDDRLDKCLKDIGVIPRN
ncbi:DUF2971 domain-containing protein [Acinetobacter sp. 197]|uniref:DUF2971 domain-containing protein n=1 Tax=Acinetobacter sp. 197 TaxID=3114696 RepID=UPI003A89F64D